MSVLVRPLASMALVALCSLAEPALAQVATATGVPNAVQGFAANRNLPIQIESATLEVRDKDRMATFADNVRLTQGDTILECKTLVVHYDEAPGASGAGKSTGAAGQAASGQGIRKLEAKGGVIVTQKDQTATGNSGLFDMKTNTVTLLGNVVVTQGQNVLRGERLYVDLTSGVSRVESASSGQGRVQGLFLPNAAKSGPNTTSSVSGPPPVVNSGPLDAARPQGNTRAKPNAAAAPKPPMQLN